MDLNKRKAKYLSTEIKDPQQEKNIWKQSYNLGLVNYKKDTTNSIKY